MIPVYVLSFSGELEEEGVMVIQFPQLIKQIVSFLKGIGAIKIWRKIRQVNF